jgi:hypothetical protein
VYEPSEVEVSTKFSFVCIQHDLELDGYPGWSLVATKPDRFSPDLSAMLCTADGTVPFMPATCAESWAVVAEIESDNGDIEGS